MAAFMAALLLIIIYEKIRLASNYGSHPDGMWTIWTKS